MADKQPFIIIDKFFQGYSPLAFQNSLTSFGSAGNASVMVNADIINGEYLTQGSGLSALTGTLTEAIQFIMDKAVATNVSYAIGTASLFTLTATSVSNLHNISGCEEGESLSLLKGNLYYFYNTSSEGRIGKYDLVSTFTDSWATGLQLAPHPSDKKEDIMVFGNGRYAGVYIQETGDLTVDKLDFGNDMEVADVLYNAGLWYIAVNSNVSGANRTEGQIFLYDGAALVNTLTDETGVGMQKIGFLYRINGIVYVAFQDLTSDGFIIGYINGKAISPLVRFTGTLPTFNKKTLYKNTILFLSDNLAYCAGALVPQLPFALSQITSSTYSTATAIGCPFGTPLIASNNGSTYVIAKFSGFTITSSWKSIIFNLSRGRLKGYIDSIVVNTKTLGAGASCSLTVEADDNTSSGTAQTITTTGKRRHVFTSFNLAAIENFRIALDFAGGSATNDCAIKDITINYHYTEN